MSPDQQGMKKAIQSVIVDLMDNVINRVLIEDPFIREKFRADKPLICSVSTCRNIQRFAF